MEQSFHRALNEPSYFLTTASSRFFKKAVGRMKCVTPVLQQEQLMENYPGFCSTQGAAAQSPKKSGLRQALHISTILLLKSENFSHSRFLKTSCQQDTSLDTAKLSLTQMDLCVMLSGTTYPVDDLH